MQRAKRAKKSSISSGSWSLLSAAIDVLDPPDDGPPDVWADGNRVIPSTGGKPGPWDTSAAPYTRGPARACVDPIYKRVGTCMMAQGGKTAGALNVALQRLDTDPAKILYVGPSKSNVTKVIFPKIDEALRGCDSLWRKTVHGQQYTTTLIKIAGVTLRLAWAGSPKELRADDAVLVLVDEIDAMDPDLNGEGSVINLADARHESYVDGKTIIFSTPTEGRIETYKHPETGLIHWNRRDPELIGSQIWKFWQDGTRFECAAPCFECAEYFIPRMDLAVIPKNSTPKQAERDGRVACPNCGSLLDTDAIRWAIPRCVFVAPGQKPLAHKDGDEGARLVDYTADPSGNVVHSVEFGNYATPALLETDDATFWISGWLNFSAKATVAQICNKLRKAEIAQDLTGVVNTTFGECYQRTTAGVGMSQLRGRKESEWRLRQLPAAVGFITAGVDIQANRKAVLLVGWAPGETAYLLDYVELPGEPDDPESWEELGRFLRRPIGNDTTSLIPRLVSVDAGNWIDHVTKWTKANRGFAIAVKGASTAGKPIIGYPSRVKPESSTKGKRRRRDVETWPVGTDTAKHLLLNRLAGDAESITVDARRIRFCQELPDEFLEHLTAETWDAVKNKYIASESVRNELLDCLVYALAAAYHPTIRINTMRDPDWDDLFAQLTNMGPAPSALVDEPDDEPVPTLPPTQSRVSVTTFDDNDVPPLPASIGNGDPYLG